MPFHISDRISKAMQSNSLSETVKSLEQTNKPYINLTSSNPTLCDLVFPEYKISHKDQILLNNYCPNAQGFLSTREAISQYYDSCIKPENLILTSSTSEAYSWLFKLLCNPKQTILISTPTYPLIYWLATLEDIVIKKIPMLYHEHWYIDLQYIEQNCTQDTKVIVIVSPNNPTGNFMSRNEWQYLLKICNKYNIALIIDEVFKDYALELRDDSVLEMAREIYTDCNFPIFIVSGLSKVIAMPQVKLSWIAAINNNAQSMIQTLLFIADQYLNLSTYAQIVTNKVLPSKNIIQNSIKSLLLNNLNTLDLILSCSPHISRLPIEGGWSVIIRRPSVEPDEDCAIRLLKQHSILTYYGHMFDMIQDGYILISLLLPPKIFFHGISNLADGLNKKIYTEA